MATLCSECELKGKRIKQIWCRITGEPCFHVRYCAVSMKYYQTDAASACKIKEQTNERQN